MLYNVILKIKVHIVLYFIYYMYYLQLWPDICFPSYDSTGLALDMCKMSKLWKVNSEDDYMQTKCQCLIPPTWRSSIRMGSNGLIHGLFSARPASSSLSSAAAVSRVSSGKSVTSTIAGGIQTNEKGSFTKKHN